MADLVQSTLVPSEQKPCLSGGATVTRATSMSIILRRNRWGISHRNMGIVSARPSLTAFLALAPRKREFDLKIPVNLNQNLWTLILLHNNKILQYMNTFSILKNLGLLYSLLLSFFVGGGGHLYRYFTHLSFNKYLESWNTAGQNTFKHLLKKVYIKITIQ